MKQLFQKYGGWRRSLILPITVSSLFVMSAVAMAAPVNVYWTDRAGGTLHKTVVQSGATSTVASGFSRLQDVDINGNTLFFADWGPVGSPGGQGSINRVQTNGSGLALVLGTGDATHQLALDKANSHIYFTRAVSYDNREISRVDMSGGNYTQLRTGTGFSGVDGWFYSGLALDVPNNVIYWGDIGVLPGPPADGAVNAMALNGAGPVLLEAHVDGKGRGMVLDAASQTLFYTAHDPSSPATGGGLFKFDIFNGVETLLMAALNTGFWDIEIDPFTNRIWWADYGNSQIWSADFNGQNAQIELMGLTNVYGIALEFANDVPEPSILALFGLGLLGMGTLRRRRIK